MGRNHFSLRALILVFAALSFGAVTLEADSQNHTLVESERSCPDSVKAKNFLRDVTGFDDLFLVGDPRGGNTLQCGCQLSDRSKSRKGGNVNFDISVLDGEGNEFPVQQPTEHALCADLGPPGYPHLSLTWPAAVAR